MAAGKACKGVFAVKNSITFWPAPGVKEGTFAFCGFSVRGGSGWGREP